MIEKSNTLEEILAHIWGSIAKGSIDSKHAYHFPVLATSSAGEVNQRVLVLRATDIKHRELCCFTDIRTKKVEDIRKNQMVHWLLYNHSSTEQIRLKAIAKLHYLDKYSQRYWQDIPMDKRTDYLGPVAPGTCSNQYVSNLPEDSKVNNSEAGRENFCVIATKVFEIDYLKLMKGGHLRAGFVWKDKQWKKSWLAP